MGGEKRWNFETQNSLGGLGDRHLRCWNSLKDSFIRKKRKKEKGTIGLFNSSVFVTMDTVFIIQVRSSWCHVYKMS